MQIPPKVEQMYFEDYPLYSFKNHQDDILFPFYKFPIYVLMQLYINLLIYENESFPPNN